MTKPQDLLLTWTTRSRTGPCVVADPHGLAPGLPPLVWDPIAGCQDAWTAQRRAHAFTTGLTTKGGDNDAARFYTAEAAKVIAGFLEPYNVDLPRPWDPATCTDPPLRTELWGWLDQFVSWINQQCLWDPGDLIPPCWPHHPHLVHEIAVLAVQRRQASRTPTAWALEQWQTHTLPTFLPRAHTRLRRHCDTDHQPTPATTAHTRHESLPETTARQARFKEDLAAKAQSR